MHISQRRWIPGLIELPCTPYGDPARHRKHDSVRGHHWATARQNNPLYLNTYGTATGEDDVKFHYIVHCSLDTVEEKVLFKRGPSDVAENYLSLLYLTEDYRVFGYITNTRVKFILVLDEVAPRDDDLVRVFQQLHHLYVDTTCNPFYHYGLPLTAPRFHKAVEAVVSSYMPQSA